MDDDVLMCYVCGMPHSVIRLVRISWVEDDPDSMKFSVRLICSADRPKSNDSLVCECCIRGIKRLPFSEIAKDQKIVV